MQPQETEGDSAAEIFGYLAGEVQGNSYLGISQRYRLHYLYYFYKKAVTFVQAVPS